MYLKRLELQGFKSFADKTVLEFMPGITSVIGPNGSGKSNISDAIRWVLGEQSMKSLRGSKSEDIIFAGTQNRKSLGFAEASIVFDNTDGKLPIEYSEVTVTRKIYRTGESGYFINKTPCRLKDVLELFMDTGIGKDGYSIIGQGKIDEILSNKSEDRRHIFEEAAGIVKYRVRKVESEKKLENTKLNLLRINDILSEIEGTIEPLKMQSEKARKFLDLREELKGIEIGLFLHNIDTYKEKLEQIKIDEDILVSNNKDAEEKMTSLNELKEKLKTEINAITEEIEAMQNIGFESSKQIEQINSNVNVANERIANNKENFARYEKEIEETKSRVQELEEERTSKIEKKTNLNNNKEKFQKELEEKEKALEELSKKLSSKELEIEAKKSQVEKNVDLKYEKNSEINTIEVNLENSIKREETLKSEINLTISELDSTRITKEDIAKTFNEIEASRNTIVKALDEINEKRNTANEKIKKYDNNINAYESEERIKTSRLKFLQETEREKEGYVKSVKALLLECDKNVGLAKGMNGVLSNLIKVEKQYETAIEMALGAALQNIVTDDEQAAKKLVEHLRKNNLGRATFLPISSVKGKKLEKLNDKEISGVIGIASDLVKINKKYEEIVLNLLGRTVIVDDMENGIKLAKQNHYSFKIVTLKGDVINPSGGITGGSVAQKTVNILGRAREIEDLEKELKAISKKIEKEKEEKEEYEKSIENVLEEVESLERNLQEIDIVYATDKQKLVAVEENVEKLQTRLEKLRNEQSEIAISKENMNKEKEEKQKEIEVILEETNKLNEEIEQYAVLNKDNQKYIDDLNFDITNLKISVSSFDESQTSIDEMVERINLDIENCNIAIENKTKQLEVITNDNLNLDALLIEYKEQIEKIKQEVVNSDSKIEELKKSRVEKNEKQSKVEAEILAQFNVIEDLKAQIVKIDVKKTKLEQDIEEIINKMWEEYEITPNNAGDFEKPTNVSETTKRVNSLRNQIKNLGSINVDAIEEYKQTKQRYDFMCEQRLDLENSIEKLKKVISDMTSTMKEQFEKQFNIINQNFGEVFRELFGGGKAELILTDLDNILECGIEIQVQPPGKKLQSMTLLSGGEKAFTAIALLFAILKINPAPFCVLDEIEAALDDVNVYRFADYLKKFSNATQFLVITHRKGTMEAADTVYGITMQENGISKLLSMKLGN
ncbi:MAG: chromosome segregation protein SMC [Clostridia bacterium]|nr:chromosome segregation protein SMC [Clostridia bacterium]